jgi:hypothetical protein
MGYAERTGTARPGLVLGLVFAPCFSLGASGVADEDAGVASRHWPSHPCRAPAWLS